MSESSATRSLAVPAPVQGRQVIAYLVNQYPRISHSFIRREIVAVEQCGVPVRRYAIRRPAEALVDAQDLEELAKTRFVLDGKTAVLWGTFCMALRRPGRMLGALGAAWSMGRRRGQGWGGGLVHLAYLAEACRLSRWMEAEGVTHLHAHFGTNSAAVARLVGRLTGLPWSFAVHGPEEFDAPEALSLREKVAESALVTVVSSFGRGQLAHWVRGGDRRKIVEVRCGLGAEYLQRPVEPWPDESRGGPTLVCVGRLCEQKAPVLLCEAFALVVGRGLSGRLVLVGDGPMRGEVEALIARRGLGDRISLVGWASGEEVRRRLAGARAMVLPSFAEGLPVAIMEALAMGRPVVSTFVAGIPELVDASCGWLVPAGDVEALAEAMAEVLAASPEHLAGLGRAGRARVIARHDAREQAERLLEAIADSQAWGAHGAV